MRSDDGYITVFFSIVIAVILSLLLTMIAGVRDSAMRLKTKNSMDISLRSAFSEYHKELWERYNLVFVDSTYGYEVTPFSMTEIKLINCMNRNLYTGGIKKSGDLFKLECFDAETVGVRLATDCGGYPIYNQTINCMLYRYGEKYVEDVIDLISEIEESGITENYESDDLDELVNANGLDGMPLIKDWVEESKAAVLKEKEVSLLSTVRLIADDIDSISKIDISDMELIEKRELNRGNYKVEEGSDLAKNLIFREYVLSYCGNYVDIKNDTVLKYETEYLIGQRSSDAENLEKVLNRILLMREAANIGTLMQDKDRMAGIEGVSEGLCALLLMPDLAPVLETIIVTLWSYIESVKDLKALTSGGKVPIVKTPEQWQSTIESIFIKESGNEGYEEGITYRDYLRILLNLSSNESLLRGLMNVIELNIDNVEGYEKFRLDNCFDAWRVSAVVFSGYGKSYEIEREMDIEEK